MKTSLRLLTVAIILLFAPTSRAAIGYVNRIFGVGDNLFVNPLQTSSNTLSVIFSPGLLPNGTAISLWNPTTLSFEPASIFASGAWSINLTLNPGTGAKLTTPSIFTNTFVGEVRDHSGAVWNGIEPVPPPPPFTGPNGVYLIGDKLPTTSTGSNIFINVLGRLPFVGEQVMTLTTTSTYLGGGNWNLVPTLNYGDAAFFNVGPVPEPTTVTLGLLGLALYFAQRAKPVTTPRNHARQRAAFWSLP